MRGENTMIAIYYYQYDINYHRWAYSSVFHCDNEDFITVTIDEPGTMAIFEWDISWQF